jgi:hypothetical protein
MTAHPREGGFSRRDYFLIPALILATALGMFGAAEIVTRILWPAHESRACIIIDKLDLPNPKPDCTYQTKVAEGPWVTYHFNSCGYRTYDSCGPKPAGTLRVVLIGSSIAEGMNVPFEQTFGQRTARAIAKATGRKVEVEDTAFEGVSPLEAYRRLGSALALKPDLIIFAVAPFDLEERSDPVQFAARNDPNATFSKQSATFEVSPIKRLQVILMNDSRAILMAQHLLFTNTDTYVRLSWSRGDKTDYLRDTLTPRWQARFDDFSVLMKDMSDRVHQAGVPLILFAVPSHQIAALLTTQQRPPHSDPFAFGRNVCQVAERVGVACVDATPDFSKVPHSDRLFYLVESHLNGEGNAVLARALERKCLDGSQLRQSNR